MHEFTSAGQTLQGLTCQQMQHCTNARRVWRDITEHNSTMVEITLPMVSHHVRCNYRPYYMQSQAVAISLAGMLVKSIDSKRTRPVLQHLIQAIYVADSQRLDCGK